MVFLILGNAGFISSTVSPPSPEARPIRCVGFGGSASEVLRTTPRGCVVGVLGFVMFREFRDLKRPRYPTKR